MAKDAGKTAKDKAKDKDKGKAKAQAKDKVPKALRVGGDAAKKKKWSKSKQKEKLNNLVFWTKPLYDKLLRDVIGKEKYVTPAIISDKLKINVSCAREALKELLSKEQIKPFNEYHSKYCIYIQGPKWEAAQAKPAAQKKEGAKEKKGKK